MRYKKKDLFEQAKEIAVSKKCFFIEQLVSMLPCAKPTFYKYFKMESNEMNTIKDILETNRVNVKSVMYKKWFDSENATLQVALMKLICTDEEAHRLNGTRQELDHTTKGESIQPTIIQLGTGAPPTDDPRYNNETNR